MDRGFYSEAHVYRLLQEHLRFIFAIQSSNTFARKAIDTVYDNFRSFENFDEQHELYAKTILSEWEYKQERPYKKDVLTDKKRIYLQNYFNIDKFAGDETNFDRTPMAMQKEILGGKIVVKHE